MKLADLQHAFWGLLTGGDDVPPAEVFLHGTEALPAAARMGIYGDMFRWRQVDALRVDFPKLALLLGDDGFLALGLDYVRAHPSVHPSLGRRGARLAAFLHAREQGALGDLAALEWARAEAFEAANALPVTVDALASLPPELFDAHRLELVPSLSLLRLGHDVLTAFDVLNEGGEVDAPGPSPTAVAVWREGFQVFHAGLSDAEARAVDQALAHASVSSLCQAFDGPEEAFSALASWFQDGWVRAVSPGTR